MKNLNLSLPRWIWIIYALLFIFSIPWYLPDKVAMQLVLGLPLWLVISTICMLAMGVFSVFVIQFLWKDPIDINTDSDE
jgi:hypothetical protein